MDFSFLTSADVVNNAAAVPVIVAIVQLFKMIDPEGRLARFSPFISLGVGILIAFLMRTPDMSIGSSVLSGLLYGLSASGLYSQVKFSSDQIKNKDPYR